MERSYHVYILRCADGTLYTGITTDLGRRIHMHNSGKGAKYTRGRTPVTLLYHETCENRAEASRRERAIKLLSRAEKEALIGAKNCDAKDALSPRPPAPILP